MPPETLFKNLNHELEADPWSCTDLCGNRSLLSRLISASEKNFHPAIALQSVEACLHSQAVRPEGNTHTRSAACLLKAFRALLQIATNPKAIDLPRHLTSASQVLDAYWPDASAVAGNFSLFPEGPGVAQAVKEWLANHQCDPRTAAVIGWLLADWCHLTLPDFHSASASVISPAGLFRLEVDLLPVSSKAGGVFVPDFPAFGLTSLRDNRPEEDILLSMERAWAASRLAPHWHGRWRIVSTPGQVKNNTANHPRQLHGRSAEAAALCTLLAATADPYGDRPPLPSETTPLDLQITLTALLDWSPPGAANPPAWDPRTIPLGVVGGSLKKLEQAADHDLHWLLFGPQAAWKVQAAKDGQQWVQEFIDAREAAHKDKRDYTGIDVGFVSTVGEALDRLLLTNRVLTRHRDRLRSDWLSRWTGDSGKASVDLRPWPPSDVSSP